MELGDVLKCLLSIIQNGLLFLERSPYSSLVVLIFITLPLSIIYFRGKQYIYPIYFPIAYRSATHTSEYYERQKTPSTPIKQQIDN